MAEYTVGSRQKRRKVAKEVSLAMELCFDQVSDIDVSAQAIRDEESNAPEHAGDGYQSLSSNDNDGEIVSNLQPEADLNYDEFWAGYESLVEPDDDSDDDSVYGSCLEGKNNDFFNADETLPNSEPLITCFKEKLASWVVINQVPQSHVDQLLI